jgi:hypothetical protein
LARSGEDTKEVCVDAQAQALFSGVHDYIYTTDANGHIDSFHADNLQFKTHDGRLPHDANTPGKQPGDHAGHLSADRFGGSEHLDNIVSQLSEVNLSKYKVIENQWAKAIEEGKHVSVDVRVTNDPLTGRPTEFTVSWTIDGVSNRRIIPNQ